LREIGFRSNPSLKIIVQLTLLSLAALYNVMILFLYSVSYSIIMIAVAVYIINNNGGIMQFRKFGMNVAITFCVVLIGQSVLTNALAQETGCEEPWNPCEGKSTLQEMNVCATKAYEEANKKLQDKIDFVLTQSDVSERQKTLLGKAQDSWRIFRWNYCIFAAAGREGKDDHPFTKFDCLERVTHFQIKNLEKFVEDLDV